MEDSKAFNTIEENIDECHIYLSKIDGTLLQLENLLWKLKQDGTTKDTFYECSLVEKSKDNSMRSQRIFDRLCDICISIGKPKIHTDGSED